MIPSRPLNLGENINESFLIAIRTWWRAAVVMLVLLALPVYMLYMGLSGFADDLHHTLKAQGMLEQQKVAEFRIDFLARIKKAYPILYQIYFSKTETITKETHIQNVDSASIVTDSLVGKHSETPPVQPQSITNFFYKNIEAFSASLWLLGIGYLFFIILSIAASTIIVDFACRSFEQRSFNFRASLKDTFSRNLWVNILQYLILIFVLLFGLGITITIAAFLPRTLIGFAVIAAFGLVVFSFIRLFLAPQAIVSEGLGPVRALQRSWSLTEGSFWRIVGISIVVLLCFVVITVLGSVPINLIFSGGKDAIMDFILGKTSDVTTTFAQFNIFIANYLSNIIVTSALFASLTPAFLTVLYYDLRTRKDGPLIYPEDEIVVTAS